MVGIGRDDFRDGGGRAGVSKAGVGISAPMQRP
jgi:hypothetical protein